MGKIVLATIIISGSAKWLLKVGGNKEKWYGSDRIFMYVMTVFGADDRKLFGAMHRIRVGRE